MRDFHDPILCDAYKIKQLNLTKLIDTEKKTFYSNLINSANNKAKVTWQLVNNSDKKQQQINIVNDNQLVTDSRQLVDLFGKHFSTTVHDLLTRHFNGALSQECTIARQELSESALICPRFCWGCVEHH